MYTLNSTMLELRKYCNKKAISPSTGTSMQMTIVEWLLLSKITTAKKLKMP